MQSDNAAYTSEYLEYRNKHNYIFSDKYKDDCEEKILADHKHKVIITNYIDQSHIVLKYNAYCSKMELYRNDIKVTEMLCIGENARLCSFIEHKNG